MRVAFRLCPGLSVSVPGLNLIESPQAQPLTEAPRVTVPVKLPTLVTVIVELAEAPAGMVRVGGRAKMVKPWTIAITNTCLAPTPDPPMTVMLYVPESV
jgi:hypothetical protein